MRKTRLLAIAPTLACAALFTLAACGDDTVGPSARDNRAPDDIAAYTSIPGLGFDAAISGSRHDNDCSYSSDTGRFVCPPVQRNGLTVQRSYAFYDTNGNPQSQFDPITTASMNTQVSVSGTHTRNGATFEVSRQSDMTVSGMAGEETTRTLNGTGSGNTRGEVTTERGTLRITTASADTTRDVVIGVPRSANPWPLSGQHISNSRHTAEGPNGTHTSSLRRVITFNGTSIVTVEISGTRGDRTCTLDLEERRLSCE